MGRRGLTLVEIMVALAIVAVIGLGLTRLQEQFFELQTRFTIIKNLESVRFEVRTRFDCHNTLEVNPCPAGSKDQVELRDNINRQLVAAPPPPEDVSTPFVGTDHRSVRVRAFCNENAREFRVEFFCRSSNCPGWSENKWKDLLVVPLRCAN